MSRFTNWKVSPVAPALMLATMILSLPSGAAVAQVQVAWSAAAEGAQVPQDIRIMQRIVVTALGEVEAPELPDELKQDPASPDSGVNYAFSVVGEDTAFWTLTPGGNSVYRIGGRDVTGFYMQGYGYLFTVNWRVGRGGSPFGASGAYVERMAAAKALADEARRAAAAGEVSEARAAGQAERAEVALEEERGRLEERQSAWDAWSAEYRDVLAEALRNVVALYGSTLKRAAPEESITFMADFGGGEAETVTVSARRGQLTGASRDENLAAVQMTKGETGVSDTLRTELKIMAEIIDGSLQAERAGDVWIAYPDEARHFGGESSYQYVPGYGVLFNKSARLDLASRVLRDVYLDREIAAAEAEFTVQALRQRREESTEEQREAYVEHLADLKQKTAEILATYGPTLTEIEDDQWVGVYYNVGSAAGLLEGGISNFLVQAKMVDIRQAGNEADGAAWLLNFLVTNEKQD